MYIHSCCFIHPYQLDYSLSLTMNRSRIIKLKPLKISHSTFIIYVHIWNIIAINKRDGLFQNRATGLNSISDPIAQVLH